MKKLLYAILFCLCACARQASPPAPDLAQDQRLERYAALCARQDAEKPYRIQASLRYGKEGDTRRVILLLWGNGPLPLRLDVMAGVGVTVAKIQDSEDSFLLHAIQEGKAYAHQGLEKPLFKAGVPVPVQLQDLANLLNGRFGPVFGTHPDGNPRQGAQGLAGFSMTEGTLPGLLYLDAAGLPVLWKQEGGDGWEIRFRYDETHPSLPHRVDIRRPGGTSAVLLVKERNFPASLFTAEQLQLMLPSDTPVLPFPQEKR